MAPEQLAYDEFGHVRIIVGMVTGLSIARLLTGLARFVQHPSRQTIYPVHLAWVGFLLLAVMHFWWFEFGLVHVPVWTFQVYSFVIGYAALFFFTSTLLFPDRMDDYAGYADYFHSRQTWFYGLLAAIFLADLVDTALKGAAHFRSLGPFYPVMHLGLGGLAIAAMRIRSRRFHVGLVTLALAAEVWLIVDQFDLLS